MKEIEIVYEDENILAINKPTGLLVHSDGKSKEKTLTDWILKKYPKIKEIGEPIELQNNEKIYRPGIVHRLDKDTSGIILIAKNQESFEDLKSQFKNREIQKNYRAFVYGDVKYDKKIIDTPIGRSKTNFKRWATTREIRGQERESVTEYETIIKTPEFSYLNVFPKTGRTHQIRVHMKYDNHPILADHLYAGKNFDRENPEKNLNFEIQALHAHKIKFKKLNGKEIELKTNLPKEFLKAEEILKKNIN
ncbi:MAG: RluA family pseudouridine synthase [Candidatus Pacebacteria bacterium]|nr:RluA family pseudouridine synthase [Candidatus Paceibacterota bacterium]